MTTPLWVATVGAWVTDQIVTATHANAYWRDNLNHLGTPASCQAFWTTNTALPTGTFTDVNWGGENYDTDSFHDNTTNPNRLTVPAGLLGNYQIFGRVQIASNSSGQRVIRLAKNGTAGFGDIARLPPVTGSATVIPFADELTLAPGDYVTIQAMQDGTASLNVTGGLVTIRKVSN